MSKRHHTPAEHTGEQDFRRGRSESTPPDTEAPAGEPQDELIRQLTIERNQAHDQYLRALADLQNFRRRAAQEKLELRQFATEQLIHDLLPVLDNFERTVAAIEAGASADAIRDGVAAIERQLRSAIETRHASRMTTTGQPFDPAKHEAVGHVETDKVPEGAVAEEIESGYTIGDRVLRPARVRVAKSPR